MNNITMAHGSGGDATSKLIAEVFREEFDNEFLNRMEDSSVVPGAGRIAMTTDSFVVKPIFYDGGDIGRLSVCGTVNDLLMSGALPRYLTAGFILEEGLHIEILKRVVRSMAETAKEAGVMIVTGDTKVVERSANSREDSGLIINTAGVGLFSEETCYGGTEIRPGDAAKEPGASGGQFGACGIRPGDGAKEPGASGRQFGACGIRPGDAVILSGNLGDHHAAILKERLEIRNDRIRSDNAPLTEMVKNLISEGIGIRAMRDVTRGGLGTVLNEFASSSGSDIFIMEGALPVSDAVRDFCGLLGLDPLYMGNEGKMICFVDPSDTDRAVDIIRGSKYGENAALIGSVEKTAGNAAPKVILKTEIGGERIVGPLYGEGLPRIC